MSIQVTDYRSKVSFNPEKASKVILSEGGHARTTLWCLLPGQHIHPHVHAGDHIWVVFEGEGMFLSENQPGVPVAAGTILNAPAGVSHGIDNTGSKDLVFVSISAG